MDYLGLFLKALTNVNNHLEEYEWEAKYKEQLAENQRMKKNHSFFRPLLLLPFLYYKAPNALGGIPGHKAKNRVKRWWKVIWRRQ